MEGETHLPSPVAASLSRDELSSTSLLSLSPARPPTSSCLITSRLRATAAANLCRSSSSSAEDRLSSPPCTWAGEEQQPAKEKTVRVEELMSAASRASLDDGPMVTAGSDCKEVSRSGGDWRRSCGVKSPRKRLSSQRKAAVSEEAGAEPPAELGNRGKAETLTILKAVWANLSFVRTTFRRLRCRLRKAEVGRRRSYFLIFHQSGRPSGFALPREEV